MSKLAGLQSALNASTGRVNTETAVQPTPVTAGKTQTPLGKAGTREGKKNIAAWLPNDFKKSIRLVQAKLPGDPSLEDLMAEAFNDLFTKYNVPTVWLTKS
jgi:hypothetical protein